MIIERIGRSTAAAVLFWAAAAPAETAAGATARIGQEIARLVGSWNRGDLEGALQSYPPLPQRRRSSKLRSCPALVQPNGGAAVDFEAGTT